MVDRVAGDHRPVVVQHPLQPFDTRNFAPGEILPGRPWSFDRVTLDGARALDGDRVEPGPFLAGPLPERADPVVEVDDLVRVRRAPGAARSCAGGSALGVARLRATSSRTRSRSSSTRCEESRVGQRLLDARLAGAEPRDALLAEIARGTLPPGVLGEPVVNRVAPIVEEILARAPTEPGTSLDVRVPLPDGRTLSGTVAGRRRRHAAHGHLLARGPAPPARRVGAAARAHRRVPRAAVRGGHRRPRAPRDADEPVVITRIPPLGADAARAELAVAARPLRPRDARAAAARLPHVGRVRGRRRERRGGGARRVGVRVDAFDKEDRDPEHLLVLGGVRTFARAARRARRAPTSPGTPDEATPLRPLGAAAVGRPAGARGMSRAVRRLRRRCRRGVTVLEASAGTGKTYTIAALAARYVAEGTPLRDLLLVTFTRMATGELRERVRERLVGVERALAARGRAPTTATRSSGCSPPRRADVVALRRDRLARALADFDAATITTTHGFCQEVLGGLGVSRRRRARLRVRRGRRRPASRRSSTTSTCAASTAARRRRSRATEARRIVEARDREPGRADRAADGADGVPAMRARLADAARDELERRKQRAGLMTYDDLLTRLHARAHRAGRRGRRRAAARAATRSCSSTSSRTPTRSSGTSCGARSAPGTLVLIGDPKQAIYAFRGADVYAYLEAARAARRRRRCRSTGAATRG